MDQATQEKGNRLCENGDIMVWNLEGRQMERGEEEPTDNKTPIKGFLSLDNIGKVTFKNVVTSCY